MDRDTFAAVVLLVSVASFLVHYLVFTQLLGPLDAELEPLDLSYVRYRPGGLMQLAEVTRFSRKEIQTIYRGFKESSPNGTVDKEQFKEIYSQFFPGGDPSKYAVFVFNTFDSNKDGSINFEEFVMGMSIICRGTMEEKLRWVFALYDTDNDGKLTRGDVWRVVASIYEMMGASISPQIGENTIDLHVDHIMKKMDRDGDGIISNSDFLGTCLEDEIIGDSLDRLSTKRT